MGNCQAVETASSVVVIQHPNGKEERVYWPLSASQVITSNPGHCVALLISSTTLDQSTIHHYHNHNHIHIHNNNNPLRLTRIKLLKPTDTLMLGQVYRLISTQEVMKGLWAKKQAKMKKNLSAESGLNQRPHHHLIKEQPNFQMHKAEQENKGERQGSRTTASSTNAAANKSRTWQPSLHSISEAAT